VGSTQPSTHPLPRRRVTFDYGDDFDTKWIPHKPEFAYAANSVSLLMPYAEPLFIKAVRHYLPDLDPALRQRTKDYIRQETQHHQQHRRFNDIIAAQYPKVERLERWMKKVFDWLWNRWSPRFNLAFAAGGEITAFGVACWTEKHLAELFDGADPIATTMFTWHLAEECEHRSSAFDVYEAVEGSRLRYVWGAFIALLTLGTFTWLGTFTMVRHDGRFWRPVTWYRMIRWSFSLAFDLLPTLLVSSLPGHHPSSFTAPVFLSKWLEQFDPKTGTMPVWQGPSVQAHPDA